MPYAAENDRVIVQHVHDFPDVMAIYRFGSTVAGNDRTGQRDVDVAVYSEQPLDVHRFWSSTQALAEGLGRDDVLLNKTAIIKHCLKRVNEEYQGHENELEMLPVRILLC